MGASNKKSKRHFVKEKTKLRLNANELVALGFEDKLKMNLSEENCEGLEDTIKCLNSNMKKAHEVAETNLGKNNSNKKKCRNLPNKIKRLLEKRRKLKRVGKDRIEYVEICKILRKKLNEWLQQRKIEMIENAVEKGKSLKEKEVPKNKIIILNDKEGNELRDKNEILKRIEEFYKELYAQLVEKESDWDIVSGSEEEESEFKEILEDEVRWAIANTKEGKAGGKDGISVEMMKAGGKTIIKELTKIFNMCITEKNIPQDWRTAKLVLLFKKGCRKDLKCYRPLSLLSSVYKIFSKILTNRLGYYLNDYLSVDQAGFRKNFSTLDHIQVLNLLVSKSEEYQFSLFLTFIDYEKAFDLVSVEKVLRMLEVRRVDGRIVKIFREIYKTAKMEVNMDELSVQVDVCRGVRQGDVASPKLFIGLLELMMNELNWEGKGLNINGRWLNQLEFADDIVVISKNKEEAQEMLNELGRVGKTYGLKVNTNKCRVMCIGNIDEKGKLELEGEEIEEEQHFIYLGQMISADGQWNEIRRRCTIGWRAVFKYKHIYKAKMGMEVKRKLWEMTALPAMIYACETWVLTQKVINKLRVTVRGMERYMLGFTRRDRKRNDWIRKKSGFKDIVKEILKRKWKWAGHIARSQDGRWTKEIMNWYPWGKRRKVGAPKLKWDGEMRKICGGVTWQRVALQRQEWKRMSKVYREVWLDRRE